MFCANETIHYAGSGVCRIQEIAKMRFGRTWEQYYVLKPLHQNASVIYVPVNSEKLVAKMRPILTREEIETLIDGFADIEPAWEDDVNLRKAKYDELIRSGDCTDLVRIIKALMQQRGKRQAEGKSLHVSDEGYLREAQRLLYDEIAGVLGKNPKEIEEQLKDKLSR